ncbi:hypothetical protein TSAR_000600 [Trichomalopsis sarcophagae]|uniref:Cytochrome P450 n=1 Tax=Trichomalopsis sarcophagae TaxID=543379 RepID=A0A232F5I5_9HYME|nr:hypothetical protein TSAR_000600 [Trichomalopsis sarcophagae]
MMLAMFAAETMPLPSRNVYTSDLAQFFINIFKKAVEHRRQEMVKRKYFLSLLMQLMDSRRVEQDSEASKTYPSNTENFDKLSLEEAAAQAFIFFIAGYETTSSTVQ